MSCVLVGSRCGNLGNRVTPTGLASSQHGCFKLEHLSRPFRRYASHSSEELRALPSPLGQLDEPFALGLGQDHPHPMRCETLPHIGEEVFLTFCFRAGFGVLQKLLELLAAVEFFELAAYE